MTERVNTGQPSMGVEAEITHAASALGLVPNSGASAGLDAWARALAMVDAAPTLPEAEELAHRLLGRALPPSPTTPEQLRERAASLEAWERRARPDGPQIGLGHAFLADQIIRRVGGQVFEEHGPDDGLDIITESVMRIVRDGVDRHDVRETIAEILSPSRPYGVGGRRGATTGEARARLARMIDPASKATSWKAVRRTLRRRYGFRTMQNSGS